MHSSKRLRKKAEPDSPESSSLLNQAHIPNALLHQPHRHKLSPIPTPNNDHIHRLLDQLPAESRLHPRIVQVMPELPALLDEPVLVDAAAVREALVALGEVLGFEGDGIEGRRGWRGAGEVGVEVGFDGFGAQDVDLVKDGRGGCHDLSDVAVHDPEG